MLNELLVAEQGLVRAGIGLTPRHPDIKGARKGLPTLLVQLDQGGRISEVRPVPPDVTPWTLRDGQHNSFPFVQPKRPFWRVSVDEPLRAAVAGRDAAARRAAILTLAGSTEIDVRAAADLTGPKFERRLVDRTAVLSAGSAKHAAERVAEGMRRFLKAANRPGEWERFTAELCIRLVQAVRDSADDLTAVIAARLLVGRYDDKAKATVAEAGLLFDAARGDEHEGNELPVWHPAIAAGVSDALQGHVDAATTAGSDACCALTGKEGPLLDGPFPQPNLPLLGQTFLFSRNTATPSLSRYKRFGGAMPVGRAVAVGLAAAAKALTEPQREGKTWRQIPGERPKQTDLLLAYVADAPDAPAAEVVTSERDLEQLAKELVETVKAKVGDPGLAHTPVRFTVLRKVDPANRKAVISGTLTVRRLEEAVKDWQAGRQLLPSGLTLPVPDKGKVVDSEPPHVAPLGLIEFTRSVFIRGGAERTEAVGITAAEALALFLDAGLLARPRAARVLNLVLRRRTPLLVGCAHARRRGFDGLKAFDRLQVLRTATVLGMLLHKLGRQQDANMTDSPAYKLGQLLAAADVVHAGYCADVRGGSLPPSLLGNQVFAAAQRSPVQALEMLCRRWKPYGAWAKPSNDVRERASKLIASGNKKDQQRGWDVRVALRHSRQWKPLAADLAEVLPRVRTDDAYRAELLLGYLAGLPKPERDGDTDSDALEGHDQR